MRRLFYLSHAATALAGATAAGVAVAPLHPAASATFPGNVLGSVVMVGGLLAVLGGYVCAKAVAHRLERDAAKAKRPESRLLGSLQSAQANLATSEARLSLALEATGDGLWDYRRGERTFFSSTYYVMLGYPPDGDHLQPENWFALVHPDDAHAVQEAMRQTRECETDLLAVELRMKTAAGAWKWVFLRGQVITRTPEGPPLRMIGTTQDIDRRHQADLALRENQELFRNAFEESAIGMAMVRPDGRLLRINSQFCTITGYSEAELLRLTFQDITHPDDLQADIEFVNVVLRGEQQHYSMEKRYIRKDGKAVWVLLHVGVVLNAQQQPQYLIAEVQDIDRRKHDEESLRAYARRLVQAKEQLERSADELVAKTAEAETARAAAETAARTQSAFLANISHEIRTPMAAIIGFAELLPDARLSAAERTRCIETIGRQGQHLLALINDILDLSKIEAGKMAVECIECDPAQVLADVEAMTAARAFDKKLELTIRVAADVPKRVKSDPTRLRQVLLNLVSNAIKFTPAGRITVDLSAAEINGVAGLRFVVADTGIGMNARQLDRMFEPFNQADVSTTRRFGGTGLGLAISKRLVEMMDGQIRVRSTVGRGSSFEVRIAAPVCETTPAAPRPTPLSLRAGLRVLIAEDGPDIQRLIVMYLTHAGIDCTVAENGRIAVDSAIAAHNDGLPFDLVLMDMQMPEMDGCHATVALREAGLTLPVLALTAHGTDEARRQSHAAGCAEHLTKPIDQYALITAIAAHTAGPNTGGGDHRPLASEMADDPRYQTLLAEYISELPAQVARLGELVGEPRAESLRRLLHQIKGAGGGYGLLPLSVAAAEAEAAFDRGEVDNLSKTVDSLISLMRSVQGYDSAGEARSCSNAF